MKDNNIESEFGDKTVIWFEAENLWSPPSLSVLEKFIVFRNFLMQANRAKHENNHKPLKKTQKPLEWFRAEL